MDGFSLVSPWWFTKFIKLSSHQTFPLYSTTEFDPCRWLQRCHFVVNSTYCVYVKMQAYLERLNGIIFRVYIQQFNTLLTYYKLSIHSKNESMKYIPKGVKYIPQMVHTIGMFCKHTKNGMLYIPLYGMHWYWYMYKCLYTLYNYHTTPSAYVDDQPVL